MNKGNDTFLFSFYFNGLIKEGNERNAVKNILKRRLDCDTDELNRIFSGGEVIFKENIDFLSVVDLIKVFKEAGAGYKIKTGSSIYSSVGYAKKKTDNSAGRSLNIDLEVELRRSKIEFDEINEKINYSSKLSNEIDRIKIEQRGKIGKKYIALNIRLNKVWEERKKIVSQLIKEDKGRIQKRLEKLEWFLNKVETESDSGIIKHLLSEIKGWNTLADRIDKNAEQSGIQPETGNPKECFIATSVFGEESFEVLFFRSWRDTVLRKSMRGRFFIRLYYAVSPPIARFLKNHLYLNRVANKILIKIIKRISNKGMKNV